MRSPSEYNGLVVIDKPPGMTSHDVVGRARKLFHTRRVGHTGTLDPDATGVLVLCLGVATRLAEYLSAARKHYVTEVAFGLETDTQDASGCVLAERDASGVTAAALSDVLDRFRGRIEQVPPMVSARHHQGRRLYELAREGVTVEREAREVTISALDLTSFAPGDHPVATLEVTCSTGTYIRTLAADIGTCLGTGAMMQSLRRTWVGRSEQSSFRLEGAYTLDALDALAAEDRIGAAVLPVSAALQDWPRAVVSDEEIAEIRLGRTISADSIRFSETIAAESGLMPVAIMSSAMEVAAIGRIEAGRLQPVKVLITV